MYNFVDFLTNRWAYFTWKVFTYYKLADTDSLITKECMPKRNIPLHGTVFDWTNSDKLLYDNCMSKNKRSIIAGIYKIINKNVALH